MSDKMEFVKLTEDEFREFAKRHPQANFYQTVEWGNLKKLLIGICIYLV